jgi:nucleoside-diphosphate-sugar epimerase
MGVMRRGAGDREPMVIVTGAGGFVGRALCGHFLRTGRPFHALVRRQPQGTALKPQERVADDLATVTDAEFDSLLAGASAVIHLAGRAHVVDERAREGLERYRQANVVATERLAQAAVRAGVARFVFASSAKVNGESSETGRPFDRDDPPQPQGAYAHSKYDAERALIAACAGTATAPIVLRLPLVYGPGVKANFLELLEEIAEGRTLPLGSVRNRRSLLFVGNLVEAIDAALVASPAPAGVHFVADDEVVSVPELLRAVASALGVKAHLVRAPVPLLQWGGRLLGKRAKVDRLTLSMEVDSSSFGAATGWRPRYSLAQGLAMTAAWWRTRRRP